MEESDFVFIGEVVSVGTSMKYQSEGWFNSVIYEIEVTENFKGTKVGEILKGRSLTSCSTHPDGGLWLMYAEKDKDGFITISQCGLSRAFYKPDQINFDQYIMPPPTMEQIENPQPNDNLDWAIDLANIRLQAARDLKDEVIWLRSQQK